MPRVRASNWVTPETIDAASRGDWPAIDLPQLVRLAAQTVLPVGRMVDQMAALEPLAEIPAGTLMHYAVGRYLPRKKFAAIAHRAALISVISTDKE